MPKLVPKEKRLADVKDIQSAKKSNKESQRRMTITLSPDVAEHLDWLAQEQGITQVAAIRKAIGLDSYIRNALRKRNSRLLIEDEDSVRELVIR